MSSAKQIEDIIQFSRDGVQFSFAARPEKDHIVSTLKKTSNFYEADLLDWLSFLNLPTGDIVDVGSCIGNHAVYFAQILNREVFAFEPNSVAFDILSTNISLNSLTNHVTLFKTALGNKKTRASLIQTSTNNIGGTTLKQATRGKVAVATLDSLLPTDSNIAFIKIDVEGWELDVLMGADNTIRRCRPVIAAECGEISAFNPISSYLNERDYVPASIFAATPVIVYCPKEQLENVFWGTPPNFWNEYRQHQQTALQFSIAKHQSRSFENSHTTLKSISQPITSIARETAEKERLLMRSQKAQLEAEFESELAKKRIQFDSDLKRELEEVRNQLSSEFTHQNEQQLAAHEDIHKEDQKKLQQANAHLRRAQNQVRELQNSLRYEIGDALALAIKAPGKNSFLLPKRMMQVILKSIQKDDSAHISLQHQYTPQPLPQEDDRITPNGIINDLPKDVSKLRVATIMDEFTHGSFSPECKLLQLTPANWETELESFRPHMLFIESAWRGKDNLWTNKVNKSVPELLGAIEWCRKTGVKTAFWNKEDPVHFDSFIGVAHAFDYIFTTDIDCIQRYKTILGHNRVYFLPFACQPKSHNPIEKFERKNRFCFAGAYYQRYPERQRDFKSLLDTLSQNHDVDIYDRNHGKNDPSYQFPQEYKKHILGSLSFEEIDIAYKGYKFAINMNSIKQSQSMFARRAFDLIGSNTVTVSNYSRGLRFLLGDCLISTDNPDELNRQLSPLTHDDLYYRKFRLRGLRKVLTEHTYKHRLQYVATKMFHDHFLPNHTSVLIVSLAQNDEELAKIYDNYRRQKHLSKRLAVIFASGFSPKRLLPDNSITQWSWSMAQKRDFSSFPQTDFISGMSAQDYYGSNYITDMVCATEYSSADCIGKSARYIQNGETTQLIHDGTQYQNCSTLPLRSSMVRRSHLARVSVDEWVSTLESNIYETISCLAIDEFNYCQNGTPEIAKHVDDLQQTPHPKRLCEAYRASESIEKTESLDSHEFLSSKTLFKYLGAGKHNNAQITWSDSGMVINSKIEENKHQYIYAKELFNLKQLNDSKDSLQFNLVAQTTIDIRVVFVFLDKKNEKISNFIGISNRNEECPVPDGTVRVRFGLRIAGSGTGNISRLDLGHTDTQPGFLLHPSPYLVLSNLYPQYNDLYRYGFLHTRLRAYKQEDLETGVLRFNSTIAPGFSEFGDIDITTGFKNELHQLLQSGKITKVLVHFLDPSMWEVLKHYVDTIKVIVWLHGSEVQPWTRRPYNYTTAKEKLVAVRDSKRRTDFWCEIFEERHPNLHFVFVSQHFADGVMEDIGVKLYPQNYSIIHNFIDGNLFSHKTKTRAHRKKILSIRPYASRTYANDLSVKAVLELSKESFFDDLEFCFIGDGPLFEETLAPLRKFNNVIIEQGFLSQPEIAERHQQYGIFLSPTRMDSQGVSRDEAMASGLVPITNRVAAIPEFVDSNCGILAEPEDASGLADGIRRLYKDPKMFLNLSNNAAKRVRDQSGFTETILKEKQLILQNATVQR